MSDYLEAGFQVKTNLGWTVRVEKLLGEGGQGAVYLVDYNGQKKALKWYKPASLGEKPEKFYASIKNNVMRGSPSKEFLWPEDITEWHDGTFGYIMDLRPQGYHDVTDFMLPLPRGVRFRSFRATADAAMHIVSAFRILHNSGYSYQDLNDGNFFINPDTGDVLICDNDNVAQDGFETGILGKPRYMAPEIVTRKKMPDSLSDRFSMSVILFIIFCMGHPLEGKRYLVPGLPPELQEKLYGTDPLFMFDPDDNGNAPHPVVHKSVIKVWNCLPKYMQEIFTNAFCQNSLNKPVARPKEKDWLDVLTRFRSEIVKCGCGNEIFVEQGRPCKCDGCGHMARIPFRLELSRYSIPAVRDTRIYRCQLGVCNETEALNGVAQVVEKADTGAQGIRNVTQKRWDAVTLKGTARKVAPGEVIPLKDGITFTIENETIAIKAN